MIAVTEGQGSKIPSVIPFVVESKGLAEDFIVRSFLYYYYGSLLANGVIHGEKLVGVRSDGMIKAVSSLYNILMLRLV